MKQRGFHDDEERDLITAYESGEFRPVKDQQTAKQTAVQAARRYLRKDARVNIRQGRHQRDRDLLRLIPPCFRRGCCR